MRLGLIARADNRGLGIQTWEFYRHLAPTKTLVVNCNSVQPLVLHLDRYPDATVIEGLPTAADCATFLRGLDVVYTAETPYNYALFREAQLAGVRSVLHYNYEFLDYPRRPHLPHPDVLAAPSTWRYDDVPYDNKQLLPVPIATDRFDPRPAQRATRFLHVVGRPAIHDRNGTRTLLAALAGVVSTITVTIRCQHPTYVADLLDGYVMPSNVTLIVESVDATNYWDNYADQDVLVMPRRFGGLCLPVNEALGAGLPVIMPDIEPNRWLPPDWLIPATSIGTFMAHNEIEIFEANAIALAVRIDRFAGDAQLFYRAQNDAMELAAGLSWDALMPEYEKVLSGP